MSDTASTSSEESALAHLLHRARNYPYAAPEHSYLYTEDGIRAFEPEARGLRVTGLDFHRYYFDAGPPAEPRNTTMVDPQVRWLGDDAALVTYVRLVQAQGHRGPATSRCEETRVWERRDGEWRHVHFHRSDNTRSRTR